MSDHLTSDLTPNPSPSGGEGSLTRGGIAAARLAGLAVLCAALMAGLGEAVLRLPALQERLPAPNIGSNYEMGAKQVRLAWLEAGQPVDCFFVGSSVVMQGIDPVVVEEALREAGGPSLRCFNEGIRGFNIGAIQRQAEELSQQQRPRLIVYGVTYRDILGDPSAPAPEDDPPAPALTVSTLADWLDTQSYLYRYYSTFRWYMNANPSALDSRSKYEASIDRRGFVREPGVWPHIERTPYPRADFQTGPAQLAALAELAKMRGDGLTLVIVEMPLPPTSVHLLVGAEEGYAEYIQAVERAAADQGAPLIHTMGLDLIPNDGWADPIHLNENGARVFSRWLGQALAGVTAD